MPTQRALSSMRTYGRELLITDAKEHRPWIRKRRRRHVVGHLLGAAY